MNKILIAFGTRSKAIKMCPLVNELKSRDSVITKVCVTGNTVLDALKTTIKD